MVSKPQQSTWTKRPFSSAAREMGVHCFCCTDFQKHTRMWHAVAPTLADAFTVICADLRGYGASGKPPSTPDHAPYSKSAMARDMVQTMRRLGLSRFSVAGHDRGGR